MATYVYDDFRVTFTPRAEGDFEVRAVDAGGAVATGVFVPPLADDELERAVLDVAHTRAVRRTRRATSPEPAVAGAGARSASIEAVTRDVGGDGPPLMDAEQLGGALADALLTGEVGVAYERAANHAASNRRGLRLTLSLAAAPALLSVPWEFMYRRPRFLASQRHTPLVRLLDTGSLVQPPTIGDKVRILAVVASPTDLAPLDVAAERRRIEQVVTPMATAERVELDWLDPATPRALRHALRDGNYHILHYVGHSAFTPEGEGMLYLEQESNGQSVGVDSTLFANLLSDQDHLRLVVLNSCEGARTTLSDPFAGVATTLIHLGVPAVVAMQFEISDDAALLFAEELYTNLVGRQDPIDASVAEARKAVYTEIDAIEWATPVLFVRDPDVELFQFKVEAATDLPPTPPPGAGEDEPPRWVRPITRFAEWVQDRPRPLRRAIAAVAVLALAAGAFLLVRAVTADEAATDFPTVDPGDAGAEVTAAQFLLNDHDVDIGVSGFFDENTTEAVRQFEQNVGIIADGVLGPLTWSELVVTLQGGADREAVRAVQTLLNQEGAELVVDGKLGQRTRAAVVRFEQDNGLNVDGIVDIEVWKLLLANASS